MDDSELEVLDRQVVLAQAGDRDALDQLLRTVGPLVLRRCTRFLLYYGDAEEAAQDALLNIATKLASFDPARGSFLAWSTVIAANSARSTYRSLKRRSAEQAGDSLVDRPEPRHTSVIAGSRIDLMDALEALEEAHPAVVEAFVLRDLGALSYEEIATLTETPPSTVKARIHDARVFMRGRLATYR